MNAKNIKILIFSAIIVAVLAGGFFYFLRKKQAVIDSQKAEANLLQLDLIDSPMDKVIAPDVNLNFPDLFGEEFLFKIPDFSEEGLIDIEAPKAEVNY